MGALNPYVIAGALALWIATGLGGFFYGDHVGTAETKAQLVDRYQRALKDFVASATSLAQKATAEALADFKAKGQVLDDLTAKLNQQQGTINAAAARLSNSLKGGSCILQPVQRQLLECVRRPGSAGCGPAAASPSR